MLEGWLQVAQEAVKVPSLLVEIYGDLAKPGVRQVGKALNSILGLGNTILWPITWVNERSRLALESNLEQYRKALETVPEEKIVEVRPEVGVPVAEKLAYVRDEKLSALYVQLLATASNQDTLGDAHPSFVNVINNLAPDEAHLLEYFAIEKDLPFLHARAMNPGKGTHVSLQDLIVSEKATENLVFPANVDAYLSNLAGLGLVQIRHDAWITDDDAYACIEEHSRPKYTELIERTPEFQGKELDLAKGVIHRTAFGRKFIAACRKPG